MPYNFYSSGYNKVSMTTRNDKMDEQLEKILFEHLGFISTTAKNRNKVKRDKTGKKLSEMEKSKPLFFS